MTILDKVHRSNSPSEGCFNLRISPRNITVRCTTRCLKMSLMADTATTVRTHFR